MSEKGKVFVYGTLKVGGHFARNFDDRRISSIPASTPGTMFIATSWFPACVFGGENTIFGELHEYEDIENVVRHLDMIEGYSGQESPRNLYNRKTVTVKTEDGEEIEAITYEFARSTEGFKVMDDGIWPIDKGK